MVLNISSHAVWPSVYLLGSKVYSNVFMLLNRWVLPFCCQICNMHFGPPHCFFSSCLFSQGKHTFLRARLLILVCLSLFLSLSPSLSSLTSTSSPCKKRSEEIAHHSSTGNKFEFRFSTNVFCHSHLSWLSLTNRILKAVSIPSLQLLDIWTFSFHWPWLGKPPVLV